MKNIDTYDILFGFVLIISLLFTIPFHEGFEVCDSGYYLHSAIDLAHGHINLANNFYANRIGVYLPYSIAYLLFGFSKYLTIITTLEFLLLLTFIYYTLRKTYKAVGLIAVCLIGFSYSVVSQAAVLLGDILITLTACGVIFTYFLLQQKKAPSLNYEKRLGIFSAFLFLYAFLVKESIAFYLPLLAVLFIFDVRKKQNRTYWFYFAFLSAIGLLLILFAYKLTTGSFLYRFSATFSVPASSSDNYLTNNASLLFERLTYQPLQFFSENNLLGLGFVLSVCQLFKPNKTNSEKFFQLFVWTTLPFWWLGSQSIAAWNPVPLIQRIWLPILVPLVINASFFIRHLMFDEIDAKMKRKYSVILITFSLLFGGLLVLSYHSYKSKGMPTFNLGLLCMWYVITLITILLSFYRNNLVSLIPAFKNLLFSVIVLSLLVCQFLFSVFHFITPPPNAYDCEKAMVDYIKTQRDHPTILSYKGLCVNYGIYDGFTTRLPFVDYNKTSIDSVSKGSFLLVNKSMLTYTIHQISENAIYTNADNPALPAYVLHPDSFGFHLIKENEKNALYVR